MEQLSYSFGALSGQDAKRFLREQLVLVLEYLDANEIPDPAFLCPHVESIVQHASRLSQLSGCDCRAYRAVLAGELIDLRRLSA